LNEKKKKQDNYKIYFIYSKDGYADSVIYPFDYLPDSVVWLSDIEDKAVHPPVQNGAGPSQSEM
jgi:hypothetical protein